jgi:hypothetical protein
VLQEKLSFLGNILQFTTRYVKYVEKFIKDENKRKRI